MLTVLTLHLAILLGSTEIGITSDPLIVTYRDGVISSSELDRWILFRSQQPGAGTNIQRKHRIEELVLLKTLVQRFDEKNLAADRDCQLRLEQQRWDLAASILRNRTREDTMPTEAELEEAYQKDPNRYRQPRRWRLENISKLWDEHASTEARGQQRSAMEKIRKQILGGLDFAEAARQESDSQTRLRGGRMGTASLDQLAPQIAAVVEDLEAGELSPIIETDEGLILLRCTLVIDASQPTKEQTQKRIRESLAEEAFQTTWREMDDRLIASLRPEFTPEVVTGTAKADAVVATIRGGVDSKRIPVLLDDYRVFLQRRGAHRAPELLGEPSHLTMLRERVLLFGRAREAESIGILDDPAIRQRFAWRRQELEARLALETEVAGLIEEPQAQELKELFRRRQEDLMVPEEMHLRALKLKIDPSKSAGFYRRLRELGQRAAAGDLGFDEVAATIGDDAELVDYGWMTRDRTFMLGRNVNSAIHQLEPGGTSSLAQEGRYLYIVNLLETKPERRLSFDEAQPRLRAALIAARTRRAEDEIRATIIREQEIRIIE